MPGSLPDVRDLHADAFLSGFGIAHGQDLAKNFVADRALTMVNSKKRSDKYPIWTKADFFRDDMQEWADGAPTPELGFRKTDGNFITNRYGGKTLLTDHDRANAEGELNIEEQKVRFLMQLAKIKRDKRFATKIFGPGLWTENTEQTGVAAAPAANQFLNFDVAGSDPIGVIRAQMDAVETSTGRLPNVLVVDALTNSVLKDHADVLDRYKHTAPAVITEELLGALWGVEYIVARATENTAAEGQAPVMSRIFGDSILLMHRTPSMSDDEPTAAALFSWSPFDFVTAEGAAIDSFREEDRKGDWFRSEQYFVQEITSNDLGVFLFNTLS